MKTKTWKAMVILNISQSLEQVTHTRHPAGVIFLLLVIWKRKQGNYQE
jgi:hypothetical protein